MHRDKQQNKLVIKVKKTEQGTEQVAEQDWRIEQAKKIEFSSSEKMFFKLEVEHMDKNVCAFLLSLNFPPQRRLFIMYNKYLAELSKEQLLELIEL